MLLKKLILFVKQKNTLSSANSSLIQNPWDKNLARTVSSSIVVAYKIRARQQKTSTPQLLKHSIGNATLYSIDITI